MEPDAFLITLALMSKLRALNLFDNCSKDKSPLQLLLSISTSMLHLPFSSLVMAVPTI